MQWYSPKLLEQQEPSLQCFLMQREPWCPLFPLEWAARFASLFFTIPLSQPLAGCNSARICSGLVSGTSEVMSAPSADFAAGAAAPSGSLGTAEAAVSAPLRAFGLESCYGCVGFARAPLW